VTLKRCFLLIFSSKFVVYWINMTMMLMEENDSHSS